MRNEDYEKTHLPRRVPTPESNAPDMGFVAGKYRHYAGACPHCCLSKSPVRERQKGWVSTAHRAPDHNRSRCLVNESTMSTTVETLERILRELKTFETQHWPDLRTLLAKRNNDTEARMAYPACLEAIRQIAEGELRHLKP